MPTVCENARRALAGEAFTTIVVVGEVVFETTYLPDRDARGALAGVLGVALDITDPVRAEARLRAREAQLQALAAHLRADLALATGRGQAELPRRRRHRQALPRHPRRSPRGPTRPRSR